MQDSRSLSYPLEPPGPAPLLPGAWEPHCLNDLEQSCFVFFPGFWPVPAVLRLTTRGRAVPTVATGAGNGSVILGLPLPLTQLTRFIST